MAMSMFSSTMMLIMWYAMYMPLPMYSVRSCVSNTDVSLVLVMANRDQTRVVYELAMLKQQSYEISECLCFSTRFYKLQRQRSIGFAWLPGKSSVTIVRLFHSLYTPLL